MWQQKRCEDGSGNGTAKSWIFSGCSKLMAILRNIQSKMPKIGLTMLPVLCIYQILVQPGLCASTTNYLSVPAVEIRGWMDFLLVASKNLLIQCALHSFIIINDISYSYKKARKVGFLHVKKEFQIKLPPTVYFLTQTSVFLCSLAIGWILEKDLCHVKQKSTYIHLKVCMVCLGYMVCFVYMVRLVCLIYRVYMVCLVCAWENK